MPPVAKNVYGVVMTSSPGPDAERHQREQQRVGARGHADAVRQPGSTRRPCCSSSFDCGPRMKCCESQTFAMTGHRFRFACVAYCALRSSSGTGILGCNIRCWQPCRPVLLSTSLTSRSVTALALGSACRTRTRRLPPRRHRAVEALEAADAAVAHPAAMAGRDCRNTSVVRHVPRHDRAGADEAVARRACGRRRSWRWRRSMAPRLHAASACTRPCARCASAD